VNGFARGHVNRCGTNVEAGVGEHFGRGCGVVLVEVGEHDMPARADTTRNRLANLAGSDDDGYLVDEETIVLTLARAES
jgi:hypothetical protein